METGRKYVVGIGEALWDVLPEGKKIGGAPANFAYHVSQFGLRMVILTCGVKGSYIFTPDSVSFMETPVVRVADTVGAGDSFTGAFVSAVLKGKPIEEAHRLAVDVSAYVCTQNGAMPVLPKSLLCRAE